MKVASTGSPGGAEEGMVSPDPSAPAAAPGLGAIHTAAAITSPIAARPALPGGHDLERTWRLGRRPFRSDACAG